MKLESSSGQKRERESENDTNRFVKKKENEIGHTDDGKKRRKEKD